ncbi:hypothetical protein BSL78_09648 [Apostichopus japonicus]|uniref:Uncharacterized protein n=1 Tax=Stichopus japonicus TaxID=307972 RepID=A0A2G8KZR5_STIJA|nr:hypothetical protein BSL78_09648 [Apostichopus japonicus]
MCTFLRLGFLKEPNCYARTKVSNASFQKDAESQTEAFSAAVTTERSVDTQKGEDTLIQLLQHLSRSHLPMFCPMSPVGLDMEQHGRETSDYTNTHCHIYMILNKRDHTYGRGKHFSQTFLTGCATFNVGLAAMIHLHHQIEINCFRPFCSIVAMTVNQELGHPLSQGGQGWGNSIKE